MVYYVLFYALWDAATEMTARTRATTMARLEPPDLTPYLNDQGHLLRQVPYESALFSCFYNRNETPKEQFLQTIQDAERHSRTVWIKSWRKRTRFDPPAGYSLWLSGPSIFFNTVFPLPSGPSISRSYDKPYARSLAVRLTSAVQKLSTFVI